MIPNHHVISYQAGEKSFNLPVTICLLFLLLSLSTGVSKVLSLSSPVK